MRGEIEELISNPLRQCIAVISRIFCNIKTFPDFMSDDVRLSVDMQGLPILYSADYIFWSFGISELMLVCFEYAILLKPVLRGVTNVALFKYILWIYLINRVWYIRSLYDFLAFKGFPFSEFIHLEDRHLLDVETSHDNDGFRNCVISEDSHRQYPSPKQMI